MKLDFISMEGVQCMRIADFNPDVSLSPSAQATRKKPARATAATPYAIQPGDTTFSPSTRSSAAASRLKREVNANASPTTASPASSSGDPFLGIPQAAIEKPAADLDRLPTLGKGEAASGKFELEAIQYWDQDTPTGAGLTRRELQYQKLAASLSAEADIRTQAGLLSPQANQVVHNALKRDDDASHGVYTVQIGRGDDARSRTALLNGFVVMTEKPLGYSYLEQTVKDRLDRPSITVVYMPGRDGTLREFPNARTAFDWISQQFRSNPAFKESVLTRQTPENQRKLSQAVDGAEQADAGGGQLKVFAQPVLGNPGRAAAGLQINTWKTLASNTDTTPPGAWLPSVGLDASRSDESRMLEIENRNSALIRDRLPSRLKNLPLSDAQKQALQSLAQDNQAQRAIAQAYYGDTPSFSEYAQDAIGRAIKNAKGVDVDPSKIMVTIPTRIQITPVSKTQLPQAPLADKVTYPLTEFIAQQMASLAPDEWRLPMATLSGPGADKLDMGYIKTLSSQLALEKNYDSFVHATFDRPSNPDQAAAYDMAQAATRKADAGTMKFDALVARRSKDLTDTEYQWVQDVIAHPDSNGRPAGADGKVTQAYGLTLNGGNGRSGTSLRDVTMFGRDGDPRIVVHTPNAPDGKVFRSYPDRSAFMKDLRGQLASIRSDDPSAWTPMATYWAGQFGAHQIKEGVSWLRGVANGKGGAELSPAPIDKDFFQNRYDYRVKHLLADADANAMTDNEVALEKTLKYAHIGYQVAKVIMPNWLTVPFEMSEVASSLFSAYQSYGLGDKENASQALANALTGAGSLAGRAYVARGELGGSRGPRPMQPAPTNQLRFEVPKTLPADTSGFVSLPPGSRFAGLHVKDGKLYAKEYGDYREVYVDQVTQTVHLQPSSGVRSLFHDPRVQRDVYGHWQIVDAPKLKGGGRTGDQEGSPNAGGDKPGTSGASAGGSATDTALHPHQRKILENLEKVGAEWKNMYVMDQKYRDLDNRDDPARIPADVKELSNHRKILADEFIRNAKKYLRSFKADDSKIPDLNVPKNATPNDFLKIAANKSHGISIGEDHNDPAAQQYIADNLDYLIAMGYKKIFVERGIGWAPIHKKDGTPTNLYNEIRWRGIDMIDVESDLSRGDDTFGKNYLLKLAASTFTGADAGERKTSFSYHMKYVIDSGLRLDPDMKYIIITGNAHASARNFGSDNIPGASELLGIPTAHVTKGRAPGVSALPGKRFEITTGPRASS
jgi:hypothetical protein